MNLLQDLLPTRAAGCPVRAGFRTMLLFEQLLADDGLPEWEKTRQALRLFYLEQPADPKAAIDGLLWFYRCGQKELAADGGPVHPPRRGAARCYDFCQDAPYVYAAFLGQYRMDLNVIPEGFCYLYGPDGEVCGSKGLHWWQFQALFRGLTADQEMVKIMGYRAVDTAGMGKAEKARYQKLKEFYRLERQQPVAQPDYQAYRQSLKDYVSARFAQASGREEAPKQA